MTAIKVPDTTAGWELYDEVPGAEDVARQLGTELSRLLAQARIEVGQGANPEDKAYEVRDAMYETMDALHGVGASDTEPRMILCAVIKRTLGVEDLPHYGRYAKPASGRGMGL